MNAPSSRYRSVFAPGLFDGQVIVVTGGGSGIGRCTAHELAALGAQAVLVGRKPEKLEQVKAENGGAIVNIVADIWGSMPNMGHSGAARAGMVSFTETAVLEWAASGVRVNAVAPGYIASSGMDHYPPEAGGMLRAMRNTVPAGRFGNEAETSAAIAFLLSPAASFISGSVLRVDGARPQVRMGWPMEIPDAQTQQRAAVRPFDGFHLAQTPRVFRNDEPND